MITVDIFNALSLSYLRDLDFSEDDWYPHVISAHRVEILAGPPFFRRLFLLLRLENVLLLQYAVLRPFFRGYYSILNLLRPRFSV